jgi:hypothetical protein
MRCRVGLITLVLVAGCGSDDGERYPVAYSGQGQVALRREEVEPRPAGGAVRERVVVVPATGPSTREVEMQRTIEALEAQSKDLQTEIDRLKREKEKGK